jgi:hypothetical protein
MNLFFQNSQEFLLIILGRSSAPSHSIVGKAIFGQNSYQFWNICLTHLIWPREIPHAPETKNRERV